VDLLPPGASRALVDHLVGLEPELVERVVARVDGNPLFAVQLVGDWVSRGVLVPSADGFRLAAGTDVSIPDDLYAVWTARLDRFLDGRPANDAVALEMAAILGQDVEGALWTRVTALAQVSTAPDLFERALAERLIRPLDGGARPDWSFVHGMLRETLERRARDAGRYAAHHRAAARALGGKNDRGIAERLARHRHEGGDPLGALDLWTTAMEERHQTGEDTFVPALVEAWEESASAAGIPESDPRRCLPLYWRAVALRALGRPDENPPNLVARSTRWAWPARERALAWLETMGRQQWAGDLQGAIAAIEVGLQWAELAGAHDIQVRLLTGSATFHAGLGRFDAALAAAQAAVALVERVPSRLGLSAVVAQAQSLTMSGRYRAAGPWLERARREARVLGSRVIEAQVLLLQADVAFEDGDVEGAERLASESLAIERALASGRLAVALHNVGLGRVLAGRPHDALALLEEAHDAFERQGRGVWINAIALRAPRLSCRARSLGGRRGPSPRLGGDDGGSTMHGHRRRSLCGGGGDDGRGGPTTGPRRAVVCVRACAVARPGSE
jgi:eukaryotic-like serine/threonine-protein kinase